MRSQNGQTRFKCLATFGATFLSASDHFGTLCIERLIESNAIVNQNIDER